MYDTLSSLIERALRGTPLPLEFYLREQSRLPGPRANLELAEDVGYLLSIQARTQPERVRSVLKHFFSRPAGPEIRNTPAEFIFLCGVIGYGACAAGNTDWEHELFQVLDHYTTSPLWRVREGVVKALQLLLPTDPVATLTYVNRLAEQSDYLSQRAAVAALAEPGLLSTPQLREAALALHYRVMTRLITIPTPERKDENFRVLRKALGYTLSIVTAAEPEQGFARLKEYATWRDRDVNWILRENLKKKRLTKFEAYAEELTQLLS